MMGIQYPKKIFIRLSTCDRLRIDELSREAEIPPSTLSRIALRQWMWANDVDPTATRKIHSSAATWDSEAPLQADRTSSED